MPFNGAGMFTRLRSWVDDAAAGIKIRADFHDIEDDNFASGISNCIARDGQSTVINNIPMNSKRITSLADPTAAQDASTKAYADTKLPLTGGTITGSLTVNGQITTTGYLCRAGLNGAYGGNWFNFLWNGNLQVWVDNYNFGNLATQAYVEQRASDWAHAVADPKVNRSGDTMTGQLTTAIGGNIGSGGAMNSIIVQGNQGDWACMSFLSNGTFGANFGIHPNGDFYCGGWSYGAGNAYKFWTTRNLNPIQDGRLAMAGDFNFGAGMNEPWGGTVVTGLNAQTVVISGSNVTVAIGARKRYMQLLTPGGWYTVGYA